MKSRQRLSEESTNVVCVYVCIYYSIIICVHFPQT